MIYIALFLAVWAVVCLSITLLVGRYLGRRPRFPSPLDSASPPERFEGTGARSGDGRGGSPRPALSRQDVPRPTLVSRYTTAGQFEAQELER